jgi:hypothetical protein
MNVVVAHTVQSPFFFLKKHYQKMKARKKIHKKTQRQLGLTFHTHKVC